MSFRKITEAEAAEIANDSEAGRMLVMERDLLRELVKHYRTWLACAKVGKEPTKKFWKEFDSINSAVGRGDWER